ncbi:hypothetical protein RvY_11496-1 [Ramazzottius varieornatus]|uniref:Receptor ligand binding region domain-containing protein n=1 Tax=Ramazzottius varieornatus TaxID=947166 RepID=A0A1D1VLP8_RAMVA|nr:hypothetical protein RvY_11496-1 [Ramazzottius varieornatus]
MMENSTLTWTRPVRVEVITMLLFYPNSMGALPLTGPAYDTALDDIKKTYSATLTVTNNLLTDPRYATCNEWSTDTDRAIAEYYFRHETRWNSADILVFAGSHSDCNAKSLVYFATQLRRLVLSSIFAFASSSDKTKWPTWISVSSDSLDILAQTHLSLLVTYNWTSLSIICDTSSPSTYCFLAGNLYSRLTLRTNFRVTLSEVNVTAGGYMDFLHKTTTHSRVILYSGHSTPFRSFMLAARSLNLTNGEYVFVTFWPFRSPTSGNFTWQFFDEFDEEARQAYRVILALGMDNGQFQDPKSKGYDVGQRCRRTAKDRYNYSYAKDDAMARAANAYTSFMILAEVLHEVVLTNQTELLSDGPGLAKKFFNRTFQTEIGDMRMSSSGELQIPYIVSAFDREGTYQSVMVRNPVTGRLEILTEPQWPNSVWPPANRPRCGYDGRNRICGVEGSSRTVVGIACTVSILAVCTFLLVFRTLRQRSLQKAGSNWWQLDDVDLYDNDRGVSLSQTRLVLE